MRDPKRIDRICRLLQTYWEAHPDLRLGQIIMNACEQPTGHSSLAQETLVVSASELRRRNWTETAIRDAIAHSKPLQHQPDPFYIEDTSIEDGLSALHHEHLT